MVTTFRTKALPLFLAILAIAAAIVGTSNLVSAKSSGQPTTIVGTTSSYPAAGSGSTVWGDPTDTLGGIGGTVQPNGVEMTDADDSAETEAAEKTDAAKTGPAAEKTDAAKTGSAATTTAAKAKCPSRTTSKMCKLYRAMLSKAKAGGFKWDRIGCYRAPDSYPYHPSGRACDLMYGPGGTAAKGSNKSDGDKMRAWLVKNHKKYKIDHVMWRGKVYSPRGNWKGYAQSGCSGKRPPVTACHYDHVHVAVTT
ncbi:hypothetical protein GCM10027280_27810 [Micromonospora polyrhachis]|uniref:ARB-07466-like C-terminal domain-containing protein n=1 Tax=Micromonospora polyrhachis TaxID=1282883 RepID=A0A7W7WPV5_9ACTN|nr:hypothetical protein [Micromonospora polyrhachis]MBB4959345.1 hypothetical protein [Micromonospora polyrhachis]